MIKGVVHQAYDMFHMSGIIQLAFVGSIGVRIFNIKTDTSIFQVAKIFTVNQTLDKQGLYCVVPQT